MGGSASRRRTFSRPLPDQSLARIRPRTSTLSEPPACTVIVPEPVLMSISTGPLTFRLRSNEPSTRATAGTAQATAIAMQTSNPTLTNSAGFISPPTLFRRKVDRSEEHTSELQSHLNLVCRLLLEKKKKS